MTKEWQRILNTLSSYFLSSFHQLPLHSARPALLIPKPFKSSFSHCAARLRRSYLQNDQALWNRISSASMRAAFHFRVPTHHRATSAPTLIYCQQPQLINNNGIRLRPQLIGTNSVLGYTLLFIFFFLLCPSLLWSIWLQLAVWVMCHTWFWTPLKPQAEAHKRPTLRSPWIKVMSI